MTKQERRAGYASLWVLALAFGWIEASVVVYLRELYAREVSLQGPDSLAGLQVTLVSMPSHLVVVEIAREACTILLLGAVAWLAGRRLADRAGAFLLSFGIWDLTYYAVLRLVSGWPDTLGSWDILFLIPVPWVAPVWAPVSVAILLRRCRHLSVLDVRVCAALSLVGLRCFSHFCTPRNHGLPCGVERCNRSATSGTVPCMALYGGRRPGSDVVPEDRVRCGSEARRVAACWRSLRGVPTARRRPIAPA